VTVSAAKIDANRRNSQRSTGPKTASGKSVVARNACKHALSSRTPNSLSAQQRQNWEELSARMADISPDVFRGRPELAKELAFLIVQLQAAIEIQERLSADLLATVNSRQLRRVHRYGVALGRQLTDLLRTAVNLENPRQETHHE